MWGKADRVHKIKRCALERLEASSIDFDDTNQTYEHFLNNMRGKKRSNQTKEVVKLLDAREYVFICLLCGN